MKRIVLLISVLCIVICIFAGCNDKNTQTNPATDSSAPELESSAESVVSQSESVAESVVSQSESVDESSVEPEDEISYDPDEYNPLDFERIDISTLPEVTNPDSLALMSLDSKEVDERFYRPAWRLYEGFDGLGFNKWTLDYDTKLSSAPESEYNEFRDHYLVASPATFDECISELRQYFPQELVENLIGEDEIVEYNGRAYVYDGARGTNIYFRDYSCVIDYVNNEYTEMYLTVTAFYRDDLEGDYDSNDPERQWQYSNTLKLSREGKNWVFTTFLLPDCIYEPPRED